MTLKLLRHDPSLFSGSSGIIDTIPRNGGSELWSPSARRNERIQKRHSQYICRIDVSGHAGIFFVLLFIFMAAPLTAPQHWPSVDLPKSDHASWLRAARREDTMRIVVSRDGKVYFGIHGISLDELPDQIRERLCGGAENRVYVYADARAKYADVKDALSGVRLAGVEHVSFVTESPHR